MIVKMHDVIKRYQGTHLALDYLSLEVHPGEVVGLLGPNGAGKTTAIKALVGLHDIDGGVIEVFGEKQHPKQRALRKKIGLVTQEVTVYEDLSAYENLRFVGRLYGLKGDHLETRIKDVANLIGLSERLNDVPKKYSGGMKRRLNIGCALLHEPSLIIMDEPTVGIDPQSRNYILSFVKDLAKTTNVSIVYTSHYIEEVEALADRVYIIDQGHIIAQGSVPALIEQMQGDSIVHITVKQPAANTLKTMKTLADIKEVTLVENTYQVITQPGAVVLDKILSLCANETILNVTSQQPDLEDVFLMLTGKTLRDGEVT